MSGCPHCLDNWPCNEPLSACVRRNKFIKNSHLSQPAKAKRHTQGTTPGHVYKLPLYYGFFTYHGYVSKDDCHKTWRRRHYRHFGFWPVKDE